MADESENSIDAKPSNELCSLLVFSILNVRCWSNDETSIMQGLKEAIPRYKTGERRSLKLTTKWFFEVRGWWGDEKCVILTFKMNFDQKRTK